MGAHTNCESMTRRDGLRLGLGALIGGGLIDALRLRGMASTADPRARATSCILIWMDGGPSHYETFDPKPDAPAEIRGKWAPIATKTPGIVVLAAHDPAGHGVRQAGDRPLDPPRPGEPWRREPLHDDRRPAPDSGRLRRLCQLPPQPGLGHRQRAGSRGRPARLLLDPEHDALGGPELPGREVRPVRRPRQPEPRELPGARRHPAARRR